MRCWNFVVRHYGPRVKVGKPTTTDERKLSSDDLNNEEAATDVVLDEDGGKADAFEEWYTDRSERDDCPIQSKETTHQVNTMCANQGQRNVSESRSNDTDSPRNASALQISRMEHECIESELQCRSSIPTASTEPSPTASNDERESKEIDIVDTVDAQQCLIDAECMESEASS